MRNLASLIESGFSLIKILPLDKVPAEGWETSEHRGRDYSEFEGFNVAIKCGTELKTAGSGRFLSVIDIDPRNGGSLEALEMKFGIFPDTFVVKTPSNGYHYYFWSEKPIRKCKLSTLDKKLKGIDFQGQGSYVLTIGSKLSNGNYDVLFDEEIAMLPQAIQNALDQKGGATVIDFSDWRDTAKIDSGGRNEYLTKMGGMMRRGGASGEEILQTLRVMNFSRCEPPLTDKEVSVIAKSMSRYAPSEAVLTSLPKVDKDQKRITLEQGQRAAAKIEIQLSTVFEQTEGLIRSIGEEILSHCDRRYNSFALASAMSIVGACAQGGYSVPHPSRPGSSSGGLSMYNWLIAPSAAGKEAYRQAVLSYLCAIDERLICPKVGSNYGLRSALFAFNSQVSVIDEMQDELDRLGGQKSSTFLNQVLTEMKELTNDLTELRPVVIKNVRYPAVKLPRYSIYGVGTIEGFIRQLNASLIGGGLLSRFAIWPITEVPHRLFQERLKNPAKENVAALRKIFLSGLTGHGETQDYDAELSRFHGLDGAKKDPLAPKITHEPQNDPHKLVMDMEPDARLMFIDFYKSQEKLYMAFVKENMASTDTSPGSVADRAPRFALKLASIHAIGCGRIILSEADAKIGITLAKILADYLCEMVSANAGETRFDKSCSKLLAKMRKMMPGVVTKRMLQAGSHLKKREFDEALLTLCQCNQILAIDPGTGQAVSLEDFKELPKGLSFTLDALT